MKSVNLQCIYEIPDDYMYIALNQDGVVMGFYNAPVRDGKLGMWQDCVTGSYGEIIPYDKWETSVRKVEDMTDVRISAFGVRAHKIGIQNAEKLKLKKGKK